MTQHFLEKIHPYILSDDPHVQNFVLRIIDEGHLGNEETFLLALEANDRKEPKAIFNNFVPRTKNIPIGEKGFRALLERMKKDDANYDWYKARVLQCSAEHFHKFRSELEEFFAPEMVNVYAKLPEQNEEEMYQNLELIAYSLEKEHEDTMFQYGKKVIENMVQRNILSNSEIAETVRGCIQEDEFDFNGLLHLYASGIANCTELIPDIAPLIHDENDEDYAVELIVEALKRMGTDEVVEHVQPLITKGFHPIGVLEAIKTEKAEEALLSAFDQVSGVMEKTSIAESLCFQLSTKGIPKVEHLIETGYDTQMLLLEEVLYPNLVINKIDHPKLDEWKDLLDKENAPEKEEQMHKEIQAKFEEFKKQKANNQATQPVNSTKVGRNEPCPCGSGKKYKKCCGK